MRRSAVFAAAVLVLSACAAEDDRPELVTTDVSSLRVTGEREQIEMFSASLSPDGKTLLYSGQDGTCVRGVDGSNEYCLDVDTDLFADSAGWSPDSGKIALVDAFPIGFEPDLWVLDVASGELTNLTDDGVETDRSMAEVPAGADVDVYPSWSADGKQIRFVRKESADAMTLMSVPADGGEPTRLRSVDTKWAELLTVAWADDTIAWLSGSPNGDDGVVRVADTVGGDPRMLLDGDYWKLSFSADGDFLLADVYQDDGVPPVGKARVVPVAGGEPVRVADGEVTQPGWAPEGHAIAYIETPDTLRVVGKPGDKPRDLHQADAMSAADLSRVQWVAGHMMVMVDDAPVVLAVDGT